MSAVTALGHAKINLALTVGPLRADGFHELDTIFQSLDLHDRITVTPVDGPTGVRRLTVGGLGAAEVPTDQSNLAWMAAELILEGIAGAPAVDIHIEKGIPTAGGMAGGSADAAATLRATAEVLRGTTGTALSEERLLGYATELGSDVPFTLLGGTRRGTGRGERLEEIPATRTCHWALAFNRRGLSTPRVFRTLDGLRSSSVDAPGDTVELRAALFSGAGPGEIAPLLVNDLEAPALRLSPRLAGILDLGRDTGALAGIVSGSGPTCGFLCADAGTARRVADAVTRVDDVIMTATATGPAPGAELVSR
ncbi:4-(cytidine 5'-diphospho)-2-C-methyl-D-erythritol kinase [Corynebacterium sp. CCM 9185]|uniref:4-diphosphocytidyl-2-C-methyl-D-erythritol kinase n=1 Tax=Corynebacterium marambiense TaxID=2765364 RepID=A0ABS0VUG5_9CORY|nr:4-(cytidine 5'-diphospho)-2-C-methyl-D-erythritol kinase [Corynebacterium marambiense]MBI9000006.1 4-(cytidine 5'-diphospho)-2-C-methyl-D-erythritol kinase [Corynebacterium marambiense]MCK7663358.1 4-(cytidine 5'-diphospho)-2-C-methyl-D-erythritol kinase [Corynebacterium marambiense]MCX7542208.1 4-(cytidine 5'-diphospho)-2-C-methyl-D-erythritol kinase [Corynebacterium marambiense]